VCTAKLYSSVALTITNAKVLSSLNTQLLLSGTFKHYTKNLLLPITAVKCCAFPLSSRSQTVERLLHQTAALLCVCRRRPDYIQL